MFKEKLDESVDNQTESASTSAANISVSMANSNLDQSNISEHPTHVVTQQENTDGTTSLSIAQVMPGGHQVTIGSLNQVSFV